MTNAELFSVATAGHVLDEAESAKRLDARVKCEFRPEQRRITFAGLNITIENPAGSIRSGTDARGKAWSQKMNHDYGSIDRTKGSSADGDMVDVFLGPQEHAPNVHVIHTNDPYTGKYSEDKVMAGFQSPDHAKAAFLSNYDRPEHFRSMTILPLATFKSFLHSGKSDSVRWKRKNKRPLATQAIFQSGTPMDESDLFAAVTDENFSAENFADENLIYRTLGAQGPEGNKHGGMRVEMKADSGEIVKGPAGTVGHKPSSIPKKPPTGRPQPAGLAAHRQGRVAAKQGGATPQAGQPTPNPTPSAKPVRATRAPKMSALSSQMGGNLNPQTPADHKRLADSAFKRAKSARAKGDDEGFAKHNAEVLKHADNMRAAQAGNTPTAVPQQPAPQASAQPQSGKPFTHADLHNEFQQMNTNRSDHVDIADLRDKVKAKYGDKAASPEVFDQMVKDSGLRMVPVSDRVSYAESRGLNLGERDQYNQHVENLRKGIPGAGEHFQYLRQTSNDFGPSNAPNAGTQTQSTPENKPLSPESLMQEFGDLHKNAGSQGVPVSELRKKIAEKHPDASRDDVDKTIKGMRGKQLRLVGGSHEGAGTTQEEREGAVHGADDLTGGKERFTHLQPHVSQEDQANQLASHEKFDRSTGKLIEPPPKEPDAETPQPAAQPHHPIASPFAEGEQPDFGEFLGQQDQAAPATAPKSGNEDIATKLAKAAGGGDAARGMSYARSSEYTGEGLAKALGIDVNSVGDLVKNGQIEKTPRGYKLPESSQPASPQRPGESLPPGNENDLDWEDEDAQGQPTAPSEPAQGDWQPDPNWKPGDGAASTELGTPEGVQGGSEEASPMQAVKTGRFPAAPLTDAPSPEEKPTSHLPGVDHEHIGKMLDLHHKIMDHIKKPEDAAPAATPAPQPQESAATPAPAVSAPESQPEPQDASDVQPIPAVPQAIADPAKFRARKRELEAQGMPSGKAYAQAEKELGKRNTPEAEAAFNKGTVKPAQGRPDERQPAARPAGGGQQAAPARRSDTLDMKARIAARNAAQGVIPPPKIPAAPKKEAPNAVRPQPARQPVRPVEAAPIVPASEPAPAEQVEPAAAPEAPPTQPAPPAAEDRVEQPEQAPRPANEPVNESANNQPKTAEEARADFQKSWSKAYGGSPDTATGTTAKSEREAAAALRQADPSRPLDDTTTQAIAGLKDYNDADLAALNKQVTRQKAKGGLDEHEGEAYLKAIRQQVADRKAAAPKTAIEGTKDLMQRNEASRVAAGGKPRGPGKGRGLGKAPITPAVAHAVGTDAGNASAKNDAPKYLEDLSPEQRAALGGNAELHMPSRERGDLPKIWQKTRDEHLASIKGHKMPGGKRMTDEEISAARKAEYKRIDRQMSPGPARKSAKEEVDERFTPDEKEAETRSKQAAQHEGNVRMAHSMGLPVPPHVGADYGLGKSPNPVSQSPSTATPSPIPASAKGNSTDEAIGHLGTGGTEELEATHAILKRQKAKGQLDERDGQRYLDAVGAELKRRRGSPSQPESKSQIPESGPIADNPRAPEKQPEPDEPIARALSPFKNPRITKPTTSGSPYGADEQKLAEQGKVAPSHTASILPADQARQAIADSGSPASAYQNGHAMLKRFASTVPEFSLNPKFTLTGDGQLQFKDGGDYKFNPAALGIVLPKGINPGETVGIDPKAIRGMKKGDVMVATRGAPVSLPNDAEYAQRLAEKNQQEWKAPLTPIEQMRDRMRVNSVRKESPEEQASYERMAQQYDPKATPMFPGMGGEESSPSASGQSGEESAITPAASPLQPGQAYPGDMTTEEWNKRQAEQKAGNQRHEARQAELTGIERTKARMQQNEAEKATGHATYQRQGKAGVESPKKLNPVAKKASGAPDNTGQAAGAKASPEKKTPAKAAMPAKAKAAPTTKLTEKAPAPKKTPVKAATPVAAKTKKTAATAKDTRIASPLSQAPTRPYKAPSVDVTHKLDNDPDAPVEMLDPKTLLSHQPHLHSDVASRINGDIRRPIIVVRHNGKDYIEEGNHRAAHAIREGKNVPAKIIHSGNQTENPARAKAPPKPTAKSKAKPLSPFADAQMKKDEPETPAQSARQGSISAKQIASIASEMMPTHGINGILPIHHLRDEVEKRHGAEAVSPENFDKALKRNRGDTHDLISVHDHDMYEGRHGKGSLRKGIQGQGETFGYISPKSEEPSDRPPSPFVDPAPAGSGPASDVGNPPPQPEPSRPTVQPVPKSAKPDPAAVTAEVKSLYNRAASLSAPELAQKANMLDGVGKSDLVKAADGIGLLGMKTNSAADIRKQIMDRIKYRHGVFQKMNMIDVTGEGHAKSDAGSFSADIPESSALAWMRAQMRERRDLAEAAFSED